MIKLFCTKDSYDEQVQNVEEVNYGEGWEDRSEYNVLWLSAWEQGSGFINTLRSIQEGAVDEDYD